MNKVFIIAEAGVNHNGRMDLAHDMIDRAAEAGVDAVKFQAYQPDRLVSGQTKQAEYQSDNTEAKESQREMLAGLKLTQEQLGELKEHCDSKNVKFLATPFEIESLKQIHSLVEAIKIGSGEVTNLPFLREVAVLGKPVILSTGMSTLAEVYSAVDQIRTHQPDINHSDFPPLTLLHCTSSYPCEPGHVNLRALDTLRESFKLPVGYSDHTLGTTIPIAATAREAVMIEKHFTLDRTMEGPDHEASIEPSDLSKLVDSVRSVEKSLGDGLKKPQESEKSVKDVARKSLVVTSNLPSGTVLEEQHVAVKRPGTGISPAELDRVLGMELRTEKNEAEVLDWDDFKQDCG